MANIKKKIMKELDHQDAELGASKATNLLRLALKAAQTSNDWRALANNYDGDRYGRLSYEVHRYWRPSDLLLKLAEAFRDGG